MTTYDMASLETVVEMAEPAAENWAESVASHPPEGVPMLGLQTVAQAIATEQKTLKMPPDMATMPLNRIFAV